MESNNLRSPTVLSDLNVNTQDDLVKKTSPSSLSNSLKSSYNLRENAKEFYIHDQENKPPGSVESTSSSTDGFIFKKPLPREAMKSEDNVLNSLIDGLSHLKLGATPIHERRFNSCKWTTPLKRKELQMDDSCSSSECSSFDKNIHHSTASTKVGAESISAILYSEKFDEETVLSRNDDDSEYYDCSDEENAIGERARGNEEASDRCNTADSSFHSVAEKEHAAVLIDGNSTFVITDSEPVNEVSLAKMNQAQGNDQAFILEKYLTEQDFKLELSMSDVSFNAVTAGIDFELGKRESICTQTENEVTSSLFSFERQEKSALCLTEYQDENNVTIQPDQFDSVASFTKENEIHTEESLFNLISDYLVQNETRSSFDTKSGENIFTLGRMSEASLLCIDTIEEEDALIQHSVRKSLLLECSNSYLNLSDVNELRIQDSQTQTATTSQSQQISVKMDIEMETINSENISHKENSSNEISESARASFSKLTDTDQSESKDASKSEEILIASVTKLNETINVESTEACEENSIRNDQCIVVADSNNASILESITTIDEIFTEINKNSEHLNETTEFSRKTCSPSSLNATMDTESFGDESFSEKSNSVVDSETNENIIESDLKRSNYLSKLNRTVDLELSQNFNLEIESQSPSYKNFNETINLKEIRTSNDDFAYRQGEVNLNQSIVSETVEESVVKNREFVINKPVDLEEIEVVDKINRKTLDNDLNESVDLNSFLVNDNCIKTPRERQFRPIHNVDFFIKKGLHEEHRESSLKIAKTINEAISETKPSEEQLDSEIDGVSDEEINEKSLDQEQLSENTHLNSIPVNIENFAEPYQESALNKTANLEKTEVNTKKTIEAVLKESVDLNFSSTVRTPGEKRFRPIHNVDFFVKENLNEEEVLKVASEVSETKSCEEKSDSEIVDDLDEEVIRKITRLSLKYVIPHSLEQVSKENIADSCGNLMRQCAELPINEIANLATTEKNNLHEKEREKSSLIESVHMTDQHVVDPIKESSEFCQFNNVEVTSRLEIGIEDITSNNLDRTTNSEKDEISNVDYSMPIQTLSHEIEEKVENTSRSLNETVDMEVTQIMEGKPKDSATFDERDRKVNLEVIKTIENCLAAALQEQVDKSCDMNTVEITEKNDENFDPQNETFSFEKPTSTLEYDSDDLDEEVIRKITRFSLKYVIPHSLEQVSKENIADSCVEIGEIESCSSQNITDINVSSTETKIILMPTHSSSQFKIDTNLSTCTTAPVSNSNNDISADDLKMESNDESYATSINETEEQKRDRADSLNVSNTNSCNATVMIHGSPSPRRSNSPARFDIHAVPMHDIASPIHPNSPTELSNKWRTQVDLSSVADHLECFTGRDSPSNSSDDMDVTDTIDSNIAPEMLQMVKLPPGINRSYSNLESIPEINENELNEEQNASEEDVIRNTKDRRSCETIGIENTELQSESIVNQAVILTSSEAQTTGKISNSTQIQTSPQPGPKPEVALYESAITAAPANPNDLVFKTPIRKLPLQSDLSAIHDSSINADFFCARTPSTKFIQSARQSLVSPKLSFYKNSPPIYSPFCTPSHRLRHASPVVSCDVPASLLDMSIGCFEKYTANQAGPTKLCENEVNKTIDVDDEPQLEETKLLYIEEPNRKVNVKTQTHDTELLDLRAENAKLTEDIKSLMELTQALASRETELKTTMQVLAHNEAELKKAVEQHEDNNRLLHNRYELLKEYSNELLARRNAELDQAEEKIRILEAKLEEYTRKAEASSK